MRLTGMASCPGLSFTFNFRTPTNTIPNLDVKSICTESTSHAGARDFFDPAHVPPGLRALTLHNYKYITNTKHVYMYSSNNGKTCMYR